jgi:hypothetical protein
MIENEIRLFCYEYKAIYAKTDKYQEHANI